MMRIDTFRILERFYLQIRGMKYLFLIPLAGYYVFIPLAAWSLGRNEMQTFDALERVSDISYSLVPILATWWNYMIHKEYVEGDGREVLLLGGGISTMTFIFYVLNVLSFLPIFIFFNDMNSGVMDLFLQMVLISFLTCGMAFFFTFMLKSISLSALAIMAFCVLSNAPSERFQQYQFSILEGNPEWFKDGTLFLFAGVAFWVIGFVQTKRL